MKTRLLPFALSFFFATSAMAADYFVVVPLKGRTAAENISVALNPYTLPGALEGSAYSFDLKSLLTVTGDSAYTGTGVTWSVVSSSLPAGLYLTADGFIGGTPTASGSGDITVRATYKTKNGEQTYQVVSAALTVSLASATLPAGTVGTAYSYDFKPLASSNDPAFSGVQASFSATGLPAGLSLAANGLLSGTPTVKNTAGSSFQILASYKGKDGQQFYTIMVNGAVLQATAIEPGGQHTCAITPSGGVKCWGLGTQGQLGQGSMVSSITPVVVYGLTGVVKLSAGYSHTCALTSSGGIKCWGANTSGKLGNGSTTDSALPVNVSGLTSGVTDLAVGGYHACAVVSTGVRCWGSGSSGELGNGGTSSSSVPVTVSNIGSGVTSISAGNNHTCVALSDGTAKCWGWNYYANVGDGTTTNRLTPVQVNGITNAAQVAAAGAHSCALSTSGGLKCWGYSGDGQLGNGTNGTAYSPVQVTGLTSGVVSVTAKRYTTCALLNTGGVKCWGNNQLGNLGIGKTGNVNIPTDVVGLTTGVSKLSSGFTHSCAVMASGGAKCWGSNAEGQVGDGSKTDRYAPVDVQP